MSEKLIKIGIIQIVSLSILAFLAVILVRQSKALKYERRIGPYALDPFSDEVSFFDKLFHYLWKIIKSISKIIDKSEFISNYSLKYEKYITIEERDYKTTNDFISIKILIAITVDFLYLLSLVLRVTPFNISTFLISTILAFFLPNLYWGYNFSQKKKQVENDLLKAIIIMNNAFKAGNNVTQAVETVMVELDGPIRDEFKKIYVDINYGLSLDIVFNRFYERVRIEDAKLLTTSLSLLNKTGGNIVKIFSLIEKSFYDRQKLKNELKSQTASSMFVFRFLLVLPIAFVLLILLLNPNYFSPLFMHKIGALVIIATFILYCSYFFIIKRITKVRL